MSAKIGQLNNKALKEEFEGKFDFSYIRSKHKKYIVRYDKMWDWFDQKLKEREKGAFEKGVEYGIKYPMGFTINSNSQ